MPKRVLWLMCAAALVGAPPAPAAELVIVDLAKEAPGKCIERTVSPGTITIHFTHTTTKLYTYSEIIQAKPISPFETTSVPLGSGAEAGAASISPSGVSDSSCAAKLTEYEKKVNEEQNETNMPDLFDEMRQSLKKGGCTEQLGVVTEWEEKCTRRHEVSLVPGQEATLTLERAISAGEIRRWTVRLSTPERGRWVITYGFTATPNRDERFWSRPTGNTGEFVIAPEERRRSEVRYMPGVFFTWLPSQDALRTFAPGFTAGVGAGKNAFGAFVGPSLLYNWNVQVSMGLSGFEITRLNGKYAAGDLIKENLTEDQLHRKTGWLGWYLALTFRLGDNPFKSEATKTSAQK